MTSRPSSRPSRRLLLAGAGLVLTVLAAGLWLLQRDEINRDRTYAIGIGGDVPMHFFGPDGQPTGVAVEIVREAARRRGIKLQWYDAEDPAAPDLDLWVLRSVRPEGRASRHFTAPYLQAESCFLVRADSPVRDVPDLVGRRIGYVDYGIHRETLPKMVARYTPRPVASSRAAVDLLLTGEADAAYVDQYTLFSTLLGGEHAPLRILPTRSPTRQLAMAARPAAAAVADEIREGMQDLVEDGTLSGIMSRWVFFPDVTADIIGDTAEEVRRLRWLLAGTVALTIMFGLSIGLTFLARRRKRQWLRSEQLFRQLHESMMDSFARFDLDHRIVETNPAFCELLGRTDAELRGMTHAELTPPRWHEEDARIVRDEVLARGYSAVHEKEYIRKDGRLFPAEVRLFLLRDGAGRPSGMWATVRDISERKQAELERERLQQQLTQAQKMEVVGRLAGGVAHDFNNMLQAILGNASLALLRLPGNNPVRGELEEIQNSALRSAELTSQLLAFARRQSATPRVLDLNETIEGLLQLLRRLIGENITIDWRPGAGLWPVRIDPTQVDQILTNLCINARDAISGQGTLVLETANHAVPEGVSTREFVRLVVRDNGRGMDEATLSHIFEPFYTTKPVGAGTGLGLATVYGIVSQNGGSIRATSTPGHGTVFELLFPRVKAEPLRAVAATPRGTGGTERGHETILLVEDEPAVLKVSRTMLEERGYRVLAAPTPPEAIRLAEAETGVIDLLVTDVVMPGMNGRDLAAALTRRRPDLRVLFMSGYDADVLAPHGVRADSLQLLQKPFSVEELARRVRAILARPAIRDTAAGDATESQDGPNFSAPRTFRPRA